MYLFGLIFLIISIVNEINCDLNAIKNYIYLRIKEERPVNTIIIENLCDKFNNTSLNQIENIDILTDSSERILKLFSIDKLTCNLIIANRIDREMCLQKLCDCNRCLVKLDVLLTLFNSATQMITLDIEIDDINDNYPIFTNNLKEFSFEIDFKKDNKMLNTLLPFNANDLDSKQFNLKAYSLEFTSSTNKLGNLITINYDSTTKKLYLTSLSSKEFAQKCVSISNCGQNCCSFDLVAYDKGKPSLTNRVKLNINIKNYHNDNADQVIPFYYNFKFIDQIKYEKINEEFYNATMNANISLSSDKLITQNLTQKKLTIAIFAINSKLNSTKEYKFDINSESINPKIVLTQINDNLYLVDLIINISQIQLKPFEHEKFKFDLISVDLPHVKSKLVTCNFDLNLNLLLTNTNQTAKYDRLFMLTSQASRSSLIIILVTIFLFISIFLVLTSIYFYINKYKLNKTLSGGSTNSKKTSTYTNSINSKNRSLALNCSNLIVKNADDDCLATNNSSSSESNNTKSSRYYDTGYSYIAHFPNGKKSVVHTTTASNEPSSADSSMLSVVDTKRESISLSIDTSCGQPFSIDSPLTGKSYHVTKYEYNGHYV